LCDAGLLSVLKHFPAFIARPGTLTRVQCDATAGRPAGLGVPYRSGGFNAGLFDFGPGGHNWGFNVRADNSGLGNLGGGNSVLQLG
jgi:hypothetical protein